MARTVVVKAGGVELRVKQGLNAANNVTGRIDGRTYEASTWAEVERKIKADYSDTRVWTKYLVIRTQQGGIPTRYNGIYPDRTSTVEVSYTITEASQVVHSDGHAGVFTRDNDRSHPHFHRGATSPEDALKWGCVSAVLVWSDALEAQLIGLCEAIEELARRVHGFISGDGLASRLLSGTTLLSLPAAQESEDE